MDSNKEKELYENLHMETEELAVPEVRFTNENEDFEKIDPEEFEDDAIKEEIGVPEIDFSGAIPEIHIIKQKN